MIIYSQKYYNKYHKIVKHYKDLNLKKSKDLYTESHHIIPKCYGGLDTKENLVRIPARVHFLLHWMLYRIYKTPEMALAWNMMRNISPDHSNRYTSKSFEYVRIAFCETNSILKTGFVHSDESKQKISDKVSGSKNGFYGKSHSEVTKEIMRSINRGENNPRYGKDVSIETREKLSKSMKGKPLHPNSIIAAKTANLGKKHSDETKAKISAIHKGKKQSPEFIAKRIEAKRINRLNRLSLET